MKTMRMCIAVAVLVCLAAAARAAETPGDSAAAGAAVPVERLIAQLASPQYADREAAMTQLMVREDLDDAMLKAAFETARSPEQTHRLTRIALHQFYRRLNPARPASITPAQDRQAGLGVAVATGGPGRLVRRHQNPQLPNPAFLVTQTLPGFPAYAYLRTGDLILAIGEHRIDDDIVFSNLIQQYRAGQPVTVRVLRDGETLELVFPLDSLGRLRAVYEDGMHGESWAMSRPEFQRHLAALKSGAEVAHNVQFRVPVAAPASAASAKTTSKVLIQ